MGKKFDEFSKKAVDALKKYKYAALVLVLGLALLLIPFRKSEQNKAETPTTVQTQPASGR